VYGGIVCPWPHKVRVKVCVGGLVCLRIIVVMGKCVSRVVLVRG
jgi:hypothetical protein